MARTRRSPTSRPRRTWRGREYLRGRARVMERAGLIIAVSDFIRGRLRREGLSGAQGRDLPQRHRRRLFQRSVAPREPVAVFVGRFVEKKGGEYLLRALGAAARAGPRVCVVS
ncbi:MAG: hypothetical protein V9E93_20120 [Steroidobacteraceae bacterium]